MNIFQSSSRSSRAFQLSRKLEVSIEHFLINIFESEFPAKARRFLITPKIKNSWISWIKAVHKLERVAVNELLNTKPFINYCSNICLEGSFKLFCLYKLVHKVLSTQEIAFSKAQSRSCPVFRPVLYDNDIEKSSHESKFFVKATPLKKKVKASEH